MNSRPRQPAFPLLQAIGLLTLVAAVVGLICLWAVPAAFNHPDGAQRGVMLMAVIAWFSLILSILPVGMLGPLGVMPTVYGYFLGGAARVVICLIMGVVLVKAALLPVGPVMVTLAAMYLPLLFVEAALVGLYLWKKDFLGNENGDVPGGALPHGSH
ncbi:MAG: hypothetical protein IT444_13110 [Phycisphaeraceae bacterium]|nr:hypothetical protein [Phycisphaeraceae bacterium]